MHRAETQYFSPSSVASSSWSSCYQLDQEDLLSFGREEIDGRLQAALYLPPNLRRALHVYAWETHQEMSASNR